MTTVNDDAAGHQFKTSDLGMHPFPEHHPAWCDRVTHLEYARENDGLLDAREMTAHYANGGDTFLTELRNQHTGDIKRDGGGSWDLTARQYLNEPFDDRAGNATPPLVQLMVSDSGVSQHAVIDMTTGEARVLAAHLVALCDRVDLPRGLQR